MRDPVYDHGGMVDHVGLLCRIGALAKAGVAASDTTMAVDPSKGGHQELYKTIAYSAAHAVELAEADLLNRDRKVQPFGLGSDHTFRDLVSTAVRNWRPKWLAGRGPFRAFKFSISFHSQKAEVSYYLRDPQPNLVVQYSPPPIMRELYELKGVFADHFLVGLHRQLYPKAEDQPQHRAAPAERRADE